ncbi:MAG: pantetheine-phosphate adenylyltransferase [Desulfobacterales bacterium]|nr:pantetheine-phosphate adenylyltransferase [Desulfobacterales bacterium]
MERLAVYPGSFDPVTNGHVDLINRALTLFDKLIVTVALNPLKTHLFTMEERVEIIREIFKDNPRVIIDSFDCLLVEYLDRRNVHVVVRGLRAVLDFEYEYQMALMNRKLDRNIESVFLMTSYRWFYISSKIIKEVASMGGSVIELVPDVVNRKLKEKFPRYRELNSKNTSEKLNGR